jgi:phosphorylcholine metabolism protein LicD
MEDKKVRIRSKYELEVRKREFLLICNILDKLNINYFLQTGVLLGAVRDNDLIKWDWDIEISVLGEEFINEIDDVAAELQKNNFIISVVNKKKNDSKIDFIGQLDESVTGYTIFSWYHSKFRKVYWRREYSVPEKYFKKFSKINFMGREFKCPNNPQEYLSFAYGNWRTPLRTSVKDEYNTGKFKNKKIFKFLEFLKTTKRFFYNLKV